MNNANRGFLTTFLLTLFLSACGGGTDNGGGTVPAVNQDPVAHAGSDQAVGSTATVVLDGSVSADPDGTIASYTWKQTSGTVIALSSGEVVRPSFTTELANDNGETLGFELTVTDNQDATATDSVSITVGAPVSPVANAGSDQRVNSTEFVTLDGSASTDDGTIVSYVWAQTSGTIVSLSSDQIIKPIFSASPVRINGEALEFELTITDDQGLTATDTVVVTVAVGDAPTANAGPDQRVVSTATVVLDGSKSMSAVRGGSIVSYAWAQISGTVIALSSFSVLRPSFDASPANDNGETLEFELTITDNQGLTAKDTVVITVAAEGGNLPPVANAGSDQLVRFDAPVTLTGASSTDSDGSIVSYAWRQISGTMVELSDDSIASPNFDASPADDAGETLVFELTVTDDEGISTVDNIAIVIAALGSNILPIANAGSDQTVNPDAMVTLDGSASSDPDGSITSYAWTQTLGTAVSLSDDSIASPTFDASPADDAGEILEFQLTVVDSVGASTTAMVSITVRATDDNLPPIADAGPDQTVDATATVTLTGLASSDSDGSIASYVWTQIAGTLVSLSDAQVARPIFDASPADDAGERLEFQLTVTDDQGDSATDVVFIMVGVNTPPIVNAGPDQTVNADAIVTLNGAGSSAGSGGITSYVWRQTSGTSVSLSSAQVVNPTFSTAPTDDAGETLVFELTVTNSGGATASDTVSIRVTGSPILAFGHHADFQGENFTVGSYLEFSDIPSGTFYDQGNYRGWTVMAWVQYQVDSDFPRFFDVSSSAGGGANNNLLVFQGNPRHQLRILIQNGATSGGEVHYNDFYEEDRPVHLAVTQMPDGSLAVYKDGIPQSPTTGGTLSTLKTDALVSNYIGRSNGGNGDRFNGILDDLAFFSRPLSLVEITAARTLGLQRFADDESALLLIDFNGTDPIANPRPYTLTAQAGGTTQAIMFVPHISADFGQVVLVDTSDGIPSLTVEIDGTPITAPYALGSSGTRLYFFYTIPSETNSPAISLIANSLSLNSGTITQQSNLQTPPLTHVGLESSIEIDDTNPQLSGLSVVETNGSVEIDYTLDEPGVVYYLVQIGGTSPTIERILRGVVGAGGVRVTSGQKLAITGTNNIDVTGLLPNTAYSFYLIATDRIGNLSTIMQTSLTTADGNVPPHDLDLDTLRFNENSPHNTLIGRLTVSDFNVVDTHTLALASSPACLGSDNDAFIITRANELRIVEISDFERQASYDICISATDNGTPALTTIFPLSIQVNNLTESLTLDNNTVPAPSPTGMVVGMIQIENADINEFTLFLSADASLGGLGIDGTNLQTIRTLEFGSYSIVLEAVNSATGQKLRLNADITAEESLNPNLTANAGPDQTIDHSTTVSLDGTLSSAGTGVVRITSHQWQQISGATVVLVGSDTSTPTFDSSMVAVEGEMLIFELTVTDSGNATVSDRVTITVRPQPVTVTSTSFSVDRFAEFNGDPQETAGINGEYLNVSSFNTNVFYTNGDYQGFSYIGWVSYGTLDAPGQYSRFLDFADASGGHNFFLSNGANNHQFRLTMSDFPDTPDTTFPAQFNFFPNDGGETMVHIAVVQAPDGTLTVYKNGQSVASGAGIIFPQNMNLTNNYFGKGNAAGAYFNGAMDDIGFFARALTPAEITQAMSNFSFLAQDSKALVLLDFNQTVEPNNLAPTNFSVSAMKSGSGQGVQFNPQGPHYHTVEDSLIASLGFSRPVFVDTSGGIPTIDLRIGQTTVSADYLRGSGTSLLSFSYTVLPSQNDEDGVEILADTLTSNGASLTDSAGDTFALTHSALTDNNIRVDTQAPQLSALTIVPSFTSISFSLTTDEPITLHVIAQVGGSAPSAADIIMGIPGIGGQMVMSASFEDITGTATNLTLAGLNTNTNYTLYLVGQDGTDILSNVLTNATTLTATTNNRPLEVRLLSNSLAENSPANTRVGDLVATDQDADQTHTFALVDTPQCQGQDNSVFSISGNQLSITEVTDFERQSSYQICIRATDSDASALSIDGPLTITVENLTETIVLSSAELPALSAPGTAVGQLSIENANTADFTFEIPNNIDQFTISGNMVQVFKPSAPADYAVAFTARNSLTDQVVRTSIDISLTAIPNPSLVVEAGADQTVEHDAQVFLYGTASTAEQGVQTIISYAWTQTSGPSVTLAAADQAVTSFDAAGLNGVGEALIFQLIVSDSGGATGMDTVMVTVNPRPASVTSVSALVPTSVQFNGDGSNGDYLEISSFNTDVFYEGDAYQGLSYVGWVRFTALGSYTRLFDIAATGEAYNFRFLNGDGNRNLEIETDNFPDLTDADFPIQTNFFPADDTLVHLAIVQAPDGVVTLYRNGQALATGPLHSFPAGITLENNYLGQSQGSTSHFNGRMNDVGFFARALSADEVEQAMNNFSFFTQDDKALFLLDFDALPVTKNLAPSSISIASRVSGTGQGVQSIPQDPINYLTGETISLILSFDQPVVVDTSGGTPSIDIRIGSQVVQAEYLANQGGRSLLFSYTLVAGQSDEDGIEIVANSLALNGATLIDAQGITPILSHPRFLDARILVNYTLRLSALTFSLPDPTSVEISLTTNELADLYAFVQTGGAAPTADNILAGQAGVGGTLVTSAQSADQPAGTVTLRLTGLDLSQVQTVFVVGVDASGNLSNVLSTSTVLPVNSAPTGITLSSATLDENVAANTLVGTLSATDVDSGDSHTFLLDSIPGCTSTDFDAFAIVNGNELQLLESPDYDTQSEYVVCIQATDDATPALSASFSLTININNLDDPDPDLSLSATSFAAYSAVGTIVGTLSLENADVADFNLSISSDSTSGSFRLSGLDIEVAEAIGFNAQEFTLTIEAVRANPALTVSKTFTLRTTAVANPDLTANAGEDQTDVAHGTEVSLDASASSAGTGESEIAPVIVSYAWVQNSGTVVSLDDATSATPSFATSGVSIDGEELEFMLTVIDSGNVMATDTVVITITATPTTFTTMISGGNQVAQFSGDSSIVISSFNTDVFYDDSNVYQGLSYVGWVRFTVLGRFARLFDFAAASQADNRPRYNFRFLNGDGDRTLEIETDNFRNPGDTDYLPNADFHIMSAPPVDFFPANDALVHLAIVQAPDGTTTLYRNGQSLGTDTLHVFPAGITLENNYLGRAQPPGSYFNGLMDDVGFFARALSAEEVGQAMNDFDSLYADPEALFLLDFEQTNPLSNKATSSDLTASMLEAPIQEVQYILRDLPNDLSQYFVVGDEIVIPVNFSRPVTVDSTNGTPSIDLLIGSATVQALYSGGTGTTRLQFSYTVLDGQSDLDGITWLANSLSLNNATLVDSLGNAIAEENPEVSYPLIRVQATTPEISNLSVTTQATSASLSLNVANGPATVHLVVQSEGMAPSAQDIIAGRPGMDGTLVVTGSYVNLTGDVRDLLLTGLGLASTYTLYLVVANRANTSAVASEPLTTSPQDLTQNSAPTAIGLSATAVDENVAINTVVGTLTATDADTEDMHSFALLSSNTCSGADNDAFTIANTNELQIIQSPDFEQKSSYTICIRAFDDATPVGAFSQSFVITINDLGDPDIVPTIDLSATSTIAHSAVGTVVGTITLTGADLSTYVLSIDTDSSERGLDLIGYALSLTKAVPFGSYDITITATGRQTSYAFSQEFTIMVTAVANSDLTADAGVAQTVAHGIEVSLDASASSAGAGSSEIAPVIVSYQWQQTSGTSVQLVDADSAQASFNSGVVDLSGEALSFELTVVDSGNVMATDTTTITVERVAAAILYERVAQFTSSPSGDTDPRAGNYLRVSSFNTDIFYDDSNAYQGFSYVGWARFTALGSYARLFDFSAADRVYNFRSFNGDRDRGFFVDMENFTGLANTTLANPTDFFPADDALVHLAIVQAPDGTTTLYRNGQSLVTGPLHIFPAGITLDNNYLGRGYDTRRYFHGRMDDVGFFSRALSAEEVGQAMNDFDSLYADPAALFLLDFDQMNPLKNQASTSTISIENRSDGVDTGVQFVSEDLRSALNTVVGGETLSVVLKFNVPVTVDTTGGTPSVMLEIGEASVSADYASGSGTTALTFSYTTLASQSDSDGVRLLADSLVPNGGTIMDDQNVPAVLTHRTVLYSHIVVEPAPEVEPTEPTPEIVAAAATPSVTSATLDFTVSSRAAVYLLIQEGGMPPTVAEVIAGTAGTGASLTRAASYLSLKGRFTGLLLDGLVASTSYDLYLVAVNSSGTRSELVSLSLTTLAPTPISQASPGGFATGESSLLEVPTLVADSPLDDTPIALADLAGGYAQFTNGNHLRSSLFSSTVFYLNETFTGLSYLVSIDRASTPNQFFAWSDESGTYSLKLSKVNDNDLHVLIEADGLAEVQTTLPNFFDRAITQLALTQAANGRLIVYKNALEQVNLLTLLPPRSLEYSYIVLGDKFNIPSILQMDNVGLYTRVLGTEDIERAQQSLPLDGAILHLDFNGVDPKANQAPDSSLTITNQPNGQGLPVQFMPQ